MFGMPPPAIALRLAEEHRYDLLKSAGKQPETGAGAVSPHLGRPAILARLHQFVRRPGGRSTSSWTASTITQLLPKGSSQGRRVRPSRRRGSTGVAHSH